MNKFDPKIYCDAAISFALQFGKQYSYQPKDIEEMDALLEMIHEHYQNKEISEQTVGKIAASQGIYLGQVMLDTKLSECGFAWSMDENGPCLAKNDNNKMYPVAKAWKRIVNGREDSVKSFFDIGIIIAEGRFPKNK